MSFHCRHRCRRRRRRRRAAVLQTAATAAALHFISIDCFVRLIHTLPLYRYLSRSYTHFAAALGIRNYELKLTQNTHIDR